MSNTEIFYSILFLSFLIFGILEIRKEDKDV